MAAGAVEARRDSRGGDPFERAAAVGADIDGKLTNPPNTLLPLYYTVLSDQVIKLAMDRVDHINISDRGKGIPSAQNAIFPLMRAKYCFKHIIGNMCADTSIKGFAVPAQALAWRVQGALTEADFNLRMASLRDACPQAATFLERIPHVRTWALYPDALSTSLHGHRTSNLVESANSRTLVARCLAPLRALDEVHTLVMEEVSAKRRLVT